MTGKMSRGRRHLWMVIGFLIGFGIGAMLVFNVLFLSKVLPHGGL